MPKNFRGHWFGQWLRSPMKKKKGVEKPQPRPSPPFPAPQIRGCIYALPPLRPPFAGPAAPGGRAHGWEGVHDRANGHGRFRTPLARFYGTRSLPARAASLAPPGPKGEILKSSPPPPPRLKPKTIPTFPFPPHISWGWLLVGWWIGDFAPGKRKWSGGGSMSPASLPPHPRGPRGCGRYPRGGF